MCRNVLKVVLGLSIALVLGMAGCGGGESSSSNSAAMPVITGGSFWVHVKHLRNDINYVKYNNEVITPLFHFILINSSGSQTTIGAYRCRYNGDLNGGKYYSEWIIDKLSSTEPNVTEQIIYNDYLGQPHSITAWYSVQIPAGFNPVTYIVGYGTYRPFSF